MTKLLKSALVTLLMTFCCAMKAEAVKYTIDGFTYNLNTENQEASLNGYSGEATEIVVPKFVTYEGNNYKVTSLGNGCFSGCSSLTSIEIPSSVTSLGDCCFSGCESLTSIEIPSSVTSLGDCCFSGCESLESIVVDANNPVYDSREGCNAIIETESNTMIAGCKSTRIPSSVTSLGNSCFWACFSLTSIEIPESVTSLGDYCFSGCSLTLIEIPGAVTSLGDNCFNGCLSLKTVICKMGNVIEDNDLFKKTPIANATLYVPKELLDTYKSTYPWSDFGTILTGEPEIVEYTTNDGFTYSFNIELQEVTLNKYNGNATEVIIPESVTYKGRKYKVISLINRCFSDCSFLTSIEIPSSVTSLGDYCFSGCSSLTSIDIPSSVTGLGYDCFSGCSSLTSINLPSSVTSLGNLCFYGCSSLTSIAIPSSVTSLGYDCFSGCSSLESITVDANNPKYDSRENCNAIIETVSNTMITGCKSTKIHPSVTSLGDCCFYGCSSLTSVEIPSSVTSLGWGCFLGCSNLTSVVSKIKEPFEVNSDQFPYISSTCTLTVPYGKREAYMAAGWTEDIFGGGIVEAPYNLATDNYLTLSDAEACKECSVVLPVNLYNPEAVTALQFELSLPVGVTLSDCLLTERKGDHTVSYSQLANGNYQVVAISLSKQNFLGSEGVLLKLSLEVGGDVPSGDYPVIVRNIELTTSDTQPVNPDDVRATLSVSDVKIADANGDGKVSITDAVAIVGHILGESVEGFATAAADVNGDGKITITDAVAVVDMILDGNASAKTRDTRAWLDPQ